MSSEEDKFKSSLRSIADSGEFPFTENDWNAASAYISSRRRKSRLRIAAALIFLVGGAVSLFMLLAPSGTGTIVSKKETQNARAENNVISSRTLQIDNPGDLQVKEETPSRSVDPLPDHKSGPAVNQANQPDPSPVTRPEPQTAAFAEKPAASQGNISVGITAADASGINDPTEKETVQVTAGEQKPASGALESSQNDEKAPILPVETAKEEIVHVSPDNNRDEESVTEDSAPAETANPETGHVPADILAEKKEQAEVVQVPVTPAVNEQSSNGISTDSVLLSTAPYLMLEGGADYLAGWKSGIKEAGGFNPFAGLHYSSYVASRLRLSVGIKYSRITNLSAFTHTSASTILSFGEESQITKIKPRSLHYMGVPLRLLYTVDRNTFGAGYTLNYLFDVLSDVETYDLSNNEITNVRNFTSRGYTDGFSMFESQISVIYRRQLNKRLILHSEAFAGINDVKQDGFFSEPGSQRALGIRVGLSYQLNGRK